mmetsp:Transcript_54680/g.62839  ORF Transcript_54680/g.62839 Transcript_54680/m.62839 type:complete len:173 (+) Transcript_54680:136-654(+)
MFFKVTLKKIVTVQPADLGATLNRRLEDHLRNAVEGKTLPEIGTVVAVLDILGGFELEGKVLDNGTVQYPLTYMGLVYKLFDGEVLDVKVTEILRDGFHATSGPARFYVSRKSMPLDYIFEGDGALAKFVTRDGMRMVCQDATVRIRVTKASQGVRESFIVGTMSGEYLGPR